MVVDEPITTIVFWANSVHEDIRDNKMSNILFFINKDFG